MLPSHRCLSAHALWQFFLLLFFFIIKLSCPCIYWLFFWMCRLDGCDEVSSKLFKTLESNLLKIPKTLKPLADRDLNISEELRTHDKPATDPLEPEDVASMVLSAVNMVFTNGKSLSEVVGLDGAAAIYSLYSLLNHSCTPNTAYRIQQVHLRGNARFWCQRKLTWMTLKRLR